MRQLPLFNLVLVSRHAQSCGHRLDHIAIQVQVNDCVRARAFHTLYVCVCGVACPKKKKIDKDAAALVWCAGRLRLHLVC